MKKVLFLLLPFVIQSCFPVSIPPNLEKGKLLEAKKFKKNLPKQYAYVFTDLKEANEFYNYIYVKFPPNEEGDSESNVPAVINGNKYYVSFYETEKKSRVVNLIPSLVNEISEKKGFPLRLEEPPIVREGTWYIVLTIQDTTFKDALNPSYTEHSVILDYAKNLHNEYLATQNYNSLRLKSK